MSSEIPLNSYLINNEIYNNNYNYYSSIPNKQQIIYENEWDNSQSAMCNYNLNNPFEYFTPYFPLQYDLCYQSLPFDNTNTFGNYADLNEISSSPSTDVTNVAETNKALPALPKHKKGKIQPTKRNKNYKNDKLKKENLSLKESEVLQMEMDNIKLEEQVDLLKNEIINIKMLLASHTSCHF